MKSLSLNVMALGLAANARISRKEEIKALQNAREFDTAMKIPPEVRIRVLTSRGMTDAQVKRLLERLEGSRARAMNIHRDRTHLVRKEARCVHLARMYLKGTPYKKVEEVFYSGPDWDRVKELVCMVTGGEHEPELRNWKMAN